MMVIDILVRVEHLFFAPDTHGFDQELLPVRYFGASCSAGTVWPLW